MDNGYFKPQFNPLGNGNKVPVYDIDGKLINENL